MHLISIMILTMIAIYLSLNALPVCGSNTGRNAMRPNLWRWKQRRRHQFFALVMLKAALLLLHRAYIFFSSELILFIVVSVFYFFWNVSSSMSTETAAAVLRTTQSRWQTVQCLLWNTQNKYKSNREIHPTQLRSNRRASDCRSVCAHVNEFQIATERDNQIEKMEQHFWALSSI